MDKIKSVENQENYASVKEITDKCLQSLGRVNRHGDLREWQKDNVSQSAGRFIRKENDNYPLIVAFPGAGKIETALKSIRNYSNSITKEEIEQITNDAHELMFKSFTNK